MQFQLISLTSTCKPDVLIPLLYTQMFIISNEDPFCIMSLTTWILSNDDLASNVTSLFYVET